jgi:molybdopterin molybdotransferase
VAEADVVLTSGGVSVGDADYTRDLLAEMGEVAFWKVAMRPGRPFAFGPLRGPGAAAWLFALPGNPVAALVTFYAFAREALLVLAGAQPEAAARCCRRAAPPPSASARGAPSSSVAVIVERAGRGCGGWQVRPHRLAGRWASCAA